MSTQLAARPGPGNEHGPTMTLTADLVALCHRDVPEPPRSPDSVRFTDADYDRAATEVLARLGDDPIWVFAYGSLLWKPSGDLAEQRRSMAFGWHRSFCIEMRSWRGSPEQPGLMMALRPGGSCTGIAQRLRGSDRHDVMVRLLRREIGGPIGYAALRLIDLHSDDGPLRALCFYADPPEASGKPELPVEQIASILARACGHAGSGAEYLFRTVAALRAVGIHDPHLWELQHHVANEIKAIHCGRGGVTGTSCPNSGTGCGQGEDSDRVTDRKWTSHPLQSACGADRQSEEGPDHGAPLHAPQPQGSNGWNGGPEGNKCDRRVPSARRDSDQHGLAHTPRADGGIRKC